MAIVQQRQQNPLSQYVASPSSRPARAKVPTVARPNRFNSGRAIGFEGRDAGTSGNASAIADIPTPPAGGAPAGFAPTTDPGGPAGGGEPGGPAGGGSTSSSDSLDGKGAESYDDAISGPAEGFFGGPSPGLGNVSGGKVGSVLGGVLGGLTGIPGGSLVGSFLGDKVGSFFSAGAQPAAPGAQPHGTLGYDDAISGPAGGFGIGPTSGGYDDAISGPEGGFGAPAGDTTGDVGPAGDPGGGTGGEAAAADAGTNGGSFGGDVGPGGDPGGGEGGGGDGCWITEAVMSTGGQDGGPELETLRQFRDTVLAATPQGQALVAEYDAIAPIVVESIMAREDALQIFQEIDAQYIVPAVAAIQKGDNQAALQIYAQMIAKVTPYAAEMSGQTIPGGQDTESMMEEFGSHAAIIGYDNELAQGAVGADPMLDQDPYGYDGGPETYSGGGMMDNSMAPPMGGGAAAFSQMFATKPRF